MQGIWPIVGRNLILFPFQLKLALGNAITVAPYNRAKVWTLLDVLVQIVETQRHILQLSVFIRYDDRLYDAAIRQDPHPHLMDIGQNVFCHRCSIWHFAKYLLSHPKPGDPLIVGHCLFVHSCRRYSCNGETTDYHQSR